MSAPYSEILVMLRRQRSLIDQAITLFELLNGEREMPAKPTETYQAVAEQPQPRQLAVSIPKRLCPCGCGARLTPDQRRCQARQRRLDDQRGSAHARGYSSKWAAYSKARLRKHPWCVKCGEPATVTNHIISAKARPDLFWEKSNHESLCTRCNLRQNIEREGGFGRPIRTGEGESKSLETTREKTTPESFSRTRSK
jgi:5-methylcytosine-specific restriction endonuclease McrA